MSQRNVEIERGLKMTVWCVNLKDNRDRLAHPADRTSEKVKYCIANDCIVIGWAEEGGSADWSAFCKSGMLRYPKGSKEHCGFACAVNALVGMKKGDLVWVVIPYSDERRLYRIKGDPETDIVQDKIDIGAYRKCELLGTYNKADLEECLQKLSARHTAERVLNKKRLNAITALCKETEK